LWKEKKDSFINKQTNLSSLPTKHLSQRLQNKNQTQKTTIRIKKKRQKRKESVLKKKHPTSPLLFCKM